MIIFIMILQQKVKLLKRFNTITLKYYSVCFINHFFLFWFPEICRLCSANVQHRVWVVSRVISHSRNYHGIFQVSPSHGYHNFNSSNYIIIKYFIQCIKKMYEGNLSKFHLLIWSKLWEIHSFYCFIFLWLCIIFSSPEPKVFKRETRKIGAMSLKIFFSKIFLFYHFPPTNCFIISNIYKIKKILERLDNFDKFFSKHSGINSIIIRSLT